MTGLRPPGALLGLVLALLAASCGGEADPPDAAPGPDELVDALCRATPGPGDAPTVESTELVEASGLVASRSADSLWWAHNDSGAPARLHALGPDGQDLGAVPVRGAANVDWEDIATGPGPDGDLLYVADIGDNAGDRPSVTVEVLPEPPAPGPGRVGPPITVERTVELTWPDGPRDAEVLLVDPRTGDLVMIDKRFGGSSGVYEADGSGAGPTPLVEVGSVDLGAAADPGEGPSSSLLEDLGAATAGDVSAAGDVIAVRTYLGVLIWPRDEGQSLAEAIVDNRPCAAPATLERQGEAIALDPDGSGYRTVSEGTNPPVNRFAGAG